MQKCDLFVDDNVKSLNYPIITICLQVALKQREVYINMYMDECYAINSISLQRCLQAKYSNKSLTKNTLCLFYGLFQVYAFA